MPSKFEWRGNNWRSEVFRGMAKRMHRATAFIEGQIKRSLRTGQPIAKLPGGHRTGVDPSLPGEPPHSLFGTLRKSIRRIVFLRESAIIGQVGTALKTGLWLEKGVRGGKTIVPRRAKALIVPTRRGVRTQSRRIKGRLVPIRRGDVNFVFRSRVRQGRIRPRPFIVPAVKNNLPRIAKILGTRIR